jgi:glycosyltransferase involved in cell wall biosynthesis
MKILAVLSAWHPHYTSSSIGKVVYNVATRLKEKGDDIDVCAPVGGDVTFFNPLYLKLTKNLVFINHFYRMLYFWLKAISFIKRNYDDYDLFWVNNPNPLIWRFANKKLFNKISFTIHTTYSEISERSKFKTLKSRIYFYFMKKAEKKFFRTISAPSSRIIVISPSVGEELLQLGLKREGIVYIPNGVDIDKFIPINPEEKKVLRNKFEIPEKKIIFLSLGRIVDVKNPIKLVETFLALEKICTDVFLLIVGKGDLFAKITKMIKNKQNVKLLGYIKIEDNPSLVACCDCHIITSSYEGQPLALLEAMSSGLACITSKIPNLESIIKSANCGLSLNFDDAKKAARTIADFIQKNKIVTLGNNARKYIENNHNWDIIANDYLNEFGKIRDGL